MLLLDTCTLLWIAQDRSQLSDAATMLLNSAAEAPVVSAISAFEIAVKARKGKLMLPQPADVWFERVIQRYQLLVEPITWQDAAASAMLPPHHNDPADRMILATAARLDATIVSPDAAFLHYPPIKAVW
jgi:PIN domain nuclease of toxin-antitoxin system